METTTSTSSSISSSAYQITTGSGSSSSSSSVRRNRRLESRCVDSSSNEGCGDFMLLRSSRFGSNGVDGEKEKEKVKGKEEVEEETGFVDDDSWSAMAISCVRIVACFVTMMFTTFVWAIIMLLLLPWPYQRVRQGNVYGHVTGRLLMWILGNPVKIEGAEFSNTRGIYICNHASPLDIFLIMWLTPTGTVGIAKKELYVLANHLRIDRSNPAMAIESLKEAARAIVKNKLSLIIFPEGTRSKTGRLLPFKKGFVHVALQSRLPIVPIILTGTHLAWRKNSLHVRPAPLKVKFLPPIGTDDWKAEKIEDYIKLVHGLYVKNLPEAQRPIIMEELDSSRSQHS